MAGAAGESLRPGLASAEPQNLCWVSKGEVAGEGGRVPFQAGRPCLVNCPFLLLSVLTQEIQNGPRPQECLSRSEQEAPVCGWRGGALAAGADGERAGEERGLSILGQRGPGLSLRLDCCLLPGLLLAPEEPRISFQLCQGGSL